MPEKKDTVTMTGLKANAFNWVLSLLMTFLIWQVKDIKESIAKFTEEIPVMKMQISYIIDGQLRLRADAIPRAQPPKHEDLITLDSLTKN